MLEVQAAQLVAHRRGDDGAFQPVALERILHARLGQQQHAARSVDQRVFDVRAQVERLVGRNRPGGGGPDDDEGRLVEGLHAEGGGQLLGLGGFEGHIQRVAALVLVFDLGLGQGRAAVEAPVHGFQAAVNEALFDQPLEQAQLARLVRLVHGLVGVVPFAQHAQALEVLHLQADLLGGEGAALGLHFIAAQVAAVQLLDLVLDRQAVAVPAGHVARVQALQLARLDDHVLQHLVDRVADVDLAVGVGRAVVQDEFLAPGAGGAQALVQAALVPLLHPARLALGQVAAHGEGRVGQVERLAVVGLVLGAHGVKPCEKYESNRPFAQA